MSQITKQLALRLPLDLHAKVVATAAENNRSGHAEMLKRLEESFDGQAEILNTDAVMRVFGDVAKRTVEVCFAKLEERVAAMLTSSPLRLGAIPVSDELSEEDFEALREQLKAEGAYSQLSDLYQRHFSNFDLRGRPTTASPTGRLSDSQPELQDLPAVSGLSTLAASVDHLGVCPECGTVTKLDLYHTGGFTGLPVGELPPILDKGERVLTATDYKQVNEQIGRGQSSVTVTVMNHEGNQDALPLTGQSWVITGSLETMTRDRAREIIIELGGSIAGAVTRDTHALVWGPGAGSKKARGEQLGVQQYTERQFIELIRKHGVDMPLPKSPDQAVAEQLS